MNFTDSLVALVPGLPEVALPVGSVVIADLHLDGGDEVDAERFGALISGLADAPVLVILGDLFEYWLGPSQAREPAPRRFLDILDRFPGRIVFIPGNRDVLAGSELESALGEPLFPNGIIGAFPDGERILLLHGDELCSADVAYLRMRRILRSRPVRTLVRALPGFITRALARRLRRHSSHTVQYKKSNQETGQDPALAQRLVAAAGCKTLLVGHAHTFRLERFEDGRCWYVLDALGGERDCLKVQEHGGFGFESTSS